MGKSSKSQSRKRARLEPLAPRSAVPEPDANDGRIEGLDIYADEVEITVATLNYLATHPNALKLKAFKNLRTAIYDVHRVHASASGTGSSLTSRISSALVDARYTDALVLLAELRIRKQQPKLGALQRWVRECDAASVGKGDGEIIWDVLEAILRTTSTTPTLGGEPPSTRAAITTHDPWVGSVCKGQGVWDELQAGTLISTADKERVRAAFRPLQTIPGPQRRPPNLYPSIIYFAPPDSIALSSSGQPVTRHDVPNVPGAFLLDNALASDECTSIIKMAETLGLIADQPAAGSAATMASVLAHNLIWLADTTFLSTFYSRIKELLPQTIAGGAVRGINARFRIYRYRPGALYRPHIDGAWPSSALAEDKTTDPPQYSYIYDSDPKLYSRLTLLIYLNDGFKGGCTTYFTPAPAGGGLDAWPVRPIMGAALVFPHGSTEGSLLHEGSGVTEGAKWVIRTEVLYEVERDGAQESEL